MFQPEFYEANKMMDEYYSAKLEKKRSLENITELNKDFSRWMKVIKLCKYRNDDINNTIKSFSENSRPNVINMLNILKTITPEKLYKLSIIDFEIMLEYLTDIESNNSLYYIDEELYNKIREIKKLATERGIK